MVEDNPEFSELLKHKNEILVWLSSGKYYKEYLENYARKLMLELTSNFLTDKGVDLEVLLFVEAYLYATGLIESTGSY